MSTILVVDDLEQNRYLLRTMLTASGFEVVEAANGAEALELAHRTPPDMIISDILMPQMDGFALCREWKRDEQLRDIPFVFCTATYTDPRDEALALQLGATRFIAKPIESAALMAILREVLQEKASGRLTAPPPELEEETAFYRLYNEALIRKLEDKMLDQERLNHQLSESEARFRRMAENVPDMIYRYEFTPKRGFTYVSPAATATTGHTPEEHYADPNLGFKLVDPDGVPLSEAANQGESSHTRHPFLRWDHKDGQVTWTEQRNVPIYNEAGDIVAIDGIARNVTGRVRRERVLEAVVAVSEVLREAQTRAEILPVLLDRVLSLLWVEGAMLEMLDPVTGELHSELSCGVCAQVTGGIFTPGGEVSAQLIATRKTYLNNDVRSDPRLFRPGSLDICSAAACAPLRVKGHVIGLLWVCSAHPLFDNDLRVLMAVADMAANAIHRAALYEETVHRVEQLEALKSIDRIIASSVDLRVTLNTVLEPIARQLQADAVAVLLLNPHMQTLDYVAGRGFRTRGVLSTHVRMGEDVAGRVALERHLVRVNDIAQLRPLSQFAALWASEGFATYHGAPLIAKGRVLGVLEVYHRSQFRPDADWLGFLDTLSGQAAIAINNGQLFDNLEHANTDLSLAYESTIEGWSHAMDIRDKETEGHTLRVTEMTLRLAKAMDMSDAELAHVRRGALLHDIGKMGVPDSILLKPDKLTEDEWTVMRMHPQLAYNLISPITYLRPALDIPYCHHEKWDGTGYPRGLKGEQIPVAARIFAVVDVWDALRSDRPYRAAWPEDKVLEYIRSLSGTHFEPRAVELFLQVVNQRS